MPKPDNVGVGVAVLVENSKGEILLLARRGAHASGTWACPGGWIDATDESPQHTVVRELLEEVDVSSAIIEPKLVDVVSEYHPDLGIRTVTIYYKVKYDGEAKILESDKCSQLQWVQPLTALFAHMDGQLQLFPKLGEVLKRNYLR